MKVWRVVSVALALPVLASGCDTAEPEGSSSPSAEVSPSPTAPLLGPEGYGALRLGQSPAEATATALITAVESGQGCSSAWLRGAPTPPPDGAAGQVVFSATLGLVAVAAYPGVITPKGVRIGSGVADLRAGYPNWESATDPGTDEGRGYAPVPGNDEAVYRIEVTDGKVISLTLQHKQQDCYE
jgi:hypothetical protein